MYIFFEESGHFKVGRLMQAQGEAFQVELLGGKRSKVKKNQILLETNENITESTLLMAEKEAQLIDLDLLWEAMDDDQAVFFTDAAFLYYGDLASLQEQIACFLALHQSPIYFRRKGKGFFQRAPLEQLEAAKLAQVKKAEQLARQQALQSQLESGEIPDEIRAQAVTLLTAPDKNSLVYKALEAACFTLQTTPEKFFLEKKVIDSPRQWIEAKFLQKHFPKGTGFGTLPSLATEVNTLPEFGAAVFSVDDSYTTEIDDAFSVLQLTDSHVQIGIHIACPGLAVHRGDDYDKVARQRLSTVYMPGKKITMFPDALVDRHSLTVGANVPALSLLIDLNPQTWELINPPQTQVFRVNARENLRYDQLDKVITQENLSQGLGEYPFKAEITLLWQWAQALRQAREIKKGKPERNQLDYSFRVLDTLDAKGENEVVITPRVRGAPLDLVVAELMIFANCYWASWLQSLQVPAIYRVQKAFGLNRTRSQTHPGSHEGLGADVYAWCTSPLRRYVDLVNQWQLLACVEHGKAARLAAPFKPKEADLMAIVSDFDATYGQYADIQSELERYWCLKWLEQHDVHEMQATAIKDELYRLADIPLVVKIHGRSDPRGSQVMLRLDAIDWFEQNVSASVIATLETSSTDMPEHEADDGTDVIEEQDVANTMGSSLANEETPSSTDSSTARSFAQAVPTQEVFSSQEPS